jgi:hypothetical protein
MTWRLLREVKNGRASATEVSLDRNLCRLLSLAACFLLSLAQPFTGLCKCYDQGPLARRQCHPDCRHCVGYDPPILNHYTTTCFLPFYPSVLLTAKIVKSFTKISDQRERAEVKRAVARIGWRPRRPVPLCLFFRSTQHRRKVL